MHRLVRAPLGAIFFGFYWPGFYCAVRSEFYVVLRFRTFSGAARCGPTHRTVPVGPRTDRLLCVDPSFVIKDHSKVSRELFCCDNMDNLLRNYPQLY